MDRAATREQAPANVALDLSPEGIRVLHRSAEGWKLLGEVPAEDPRLDAALDELRRRLEALEPGGLRAEVVVPRSQVLYTRVQAPGPRRSAQVARAIEATVSLSPEELAWDFRALPDGSAAVAVTERQTLREAEAFASAHGFPPVCFTAWPDGDAFPGIPLFAAADEPVARPKAAVAAEDIEGAMTPAQPMERGLERLPLKLTGAQAAQPGSGDPPRAAAGPDVAPKAGDIAVWGGALDPVPGPRSGSEVDTAAVAQGGDAEVEQRFRSQRLARLNGASGAEPGSGGGEAPAPRSERPAPSRLGAFLPRIGLASAVVPTGEPAGEDVRSEAAGAAPAFSRGAGSDRSEKSFGGALALPAAATSPIAEKDPRDTARAGMAADQQDPSWSDGLQKPEPRPPGREGEAGARQVPAAASNGRPVLGERRSPGRAAAAGDQLAGAEQGIGPTRSPAAAGKLGETAALTSGQRRAAARPRRSAPRIVITIAVGLVALILGFLLLRESGSVVGPSAVSVDPEVGTAAFPNALPEVLAVDRSSDGPAAAVGDPLTRASDVADPTVLAAEGPPVSEPAAAASAGSVLTERGLASLPWALSGVPREAGPSRAAGWLDPLAPTARIRFAGAGEPAPVIDVIAGTAPLAFPSRDGAGSLGAATPAEQGARVGVADGAAARAVEQLRTAPTALLPAPARPPAAGDRFAASATDAAPTPPAAGAGQGSAARGSGMDGGSAAALGEPATQAPPQAGQAASGATASVSGVAASESGDAQLTSLLPAAQRTDDAGASTPAGAAAAGAATTNAGGSGRPSAEADPLVQPTESAGSVSLTATAVREFPADASTSTLGAAAGARAIARLAAEAEAADRLALAGPPAAGSRTGPDDRASVRPLPSTGQPALDAPPAEAGAAARDLDAERDPLASGAEPALSPEVPDVGSEGVALSRSSAGVPQSEIAGDPAASADESVPVPGAVGSAEAAATADAMPSLEEVPTPELAATPEGVLTAEGVLVRAAQPPARPPAHPDRPAGAPAVLVGALAPRAPSEAAPSTQAVGALSPSAEGGLAGADPAAAVTTSSLVAEAAAGLAGAATGQRPRPRPAALAAGVADAGTTPEFPDDALVASVLPPPRPADFAALAAAALAQSSAAAARAALAPRTPAPPVEEVDDEPEPRAAPSLPTQASVARQATAEGALNLGRMNLIGVFGAPTDRRALVRLSNGRFVRVGVGDQIDGGRVAAIGQSELRYVKGGRAFVLQMPRT